MAFDKGVAGKLMRRLQQWGKVSKERVDTTGCAMEEEGY